MPEIVNYWKLNSVYVIITVLVFIVFLVVNIILFIRLQIELSIELNTNCKNPLAIYFNKNERDRCLTDKIMKNKEMQVPLRNYNNKKVKITEKINTMNSRLVDISNVFEILKMGPELVKVEKVVTDISNSYYTILYKKYEDISNNTGKMINGIVENGKKITGFKDTINDNIIKLISVGNMLLGKIIEKIPIDTNWYKGFEVKTFNNIITYLNTVSDPNVNMNIKLETQETAKNAVNNYQQQMKPYSDRMNADATINE